ncbi:MAG: hypothetical protein JWQ87_5414 [Candidatus Sulfotelmatobacter sp.]|nr:hypothetical protein [Candidatus Sulfotelmatobacter sp.]
MQKRKMPTDPLEKSIYLRERSIARMKENIRGIRADAEEAVAEVEKRIKEKHVLLDALKRGKL